MGTRFLIIDLNLNFKRNFVFRRNNLRFKLLQDGATEQVIPESLPETTNEIPEIPAQVPENN